MNKNEFLIVKNDLEEEKKFLLEQWKCAGVGMSGDYWVKIQEVDKKINQLEALFMNPQFSQKFQHIENKPIIDEIMLKRKLSERQVEFVIDNLLDTFQSYSILFDNIIILKAQWLDIKKQGTIGSLTIEEVATKQTKVIKALLDFINENGKSKND